MSPIQEKEPRSKFHCSIAQPLTILSHPRWKSCCKKIKNKKLKRNKKNLAGNLIQAFVQFIIEYYKNKYPSVENKLKKQL